MPLNSRGVKPRLEGSISVQDRSTRMGIAAGAPDLIEDAGDPGLAVGIRVMFTGPFPPSL